MLPLKRPIYASAPVTAKGVPRGGREDLLVKRFSRQSYEAGGQEEVQKERNGKDGGG